MNDTNMTPAVHTAVALFTIRERLQFLRVGAEQGRLPMVALRQGEGLEAGARRALETATGIEDVFLEQLYTFDGGRAGVQAIVAYYALAPCERLPIRRPGVGWADPAQAATLLAMDHQIIVQRACERLAGKLEYAPIAYQFLAERFTLSELQTVYEIIGRQTLDKRNFRRRMHASAHLVETRDVRRNGCHRPARLYRLRDTEPATAG
ncbi:MAG: NUDIX hydrolase [Acidiferrobacter thiooxydans]